MADPSISRRNLLLGLGGGALVGGAALAGGQQVAQAQGPTEPASSKINVDNTGVDSGSVGARQIDCHGQHQAGITSPTQTHTEYVSLAIPPSVKSRDLQKLMRDWSRSIERMTLGLPHESDTGEELFANGPARLTATVSFGPGFFDRDGLTQFKPDGLNQLPTFHHDHLENKWTGGDLFVQVCSDDPVITSHAARVLIVQASDFAKVRWIQKGFARAAGMTSQAGSTQRNLMGQLDGTGNPRGTDDDFNSILWTPKDAGIWAQGGSFVVVRRIRMLLDHWEVHTRVEQEDAIGRRKDNGAPLTGDSESDEPDFSAQRDDGRLTIPADAHVRLTHHSSTNGAKILRRGYSFDDGYLAGGENDSGLLFIAWQADPRKGFMPIQARMDVGDALNHMISTEGSAIAFAPPGFQKDSYLGHSLFEA